MKREKPAVRVRASSFLGGACRTAQRPPERRIPVRNHPFSFRPSFSLPPSPSAGPRTQLEIARPLWYIDACIGPSRPQFFGAQQPMSRESTYSIRPFRGRRRHTRASQCPALLTHFCPQHGPALPNWKFSKLLTNSLPTVSPQTQAARSQIGNLHPCGPTHSQPSAGEHPLQHILEM